MPHTTRLFPLLDDPAHEPLYRQCHGQRITIDPRTRLSRHGFFSFLFCPILKPRVVLSLSLSLPWFCRCNNLLQDGHFSPPRKHQPPDPTVLTISCLTTTDVPSFSSILRTAINSRLPYSFILIQARLINDSKGSTRAFPPFTPTIPRPFT